MHGPILGAFLGAVPRCGCRSDKLSDTGLRRAVLKPLTRFMLASVCSLCSNDFVDAAHLGCIFNQSPGDERHSIPLRQAILCPLFEAILNPRYALVPREALLSDWAEIAECPVAPGKCNLVTFEFISCCFRGCEEWTGKIRGHGRCETLCLFRC